MRLVCSKQAEEAGHEREVSWIGEEYGDTGVIVIENNEVTEKRPIE